MEISKIQAASIKSIEKNKPAHAAEAPRDTLRISPEAGKIRGWVEMVQQMPDVRSEKIAALNTLDRPEIYLDLAKKMMEE